MLHHDEDISHLHLFVLLVNIDSLLVVWNSLRYHFRSIGVYLDATEKFLDLCLDMVYIHVTDYDDSLVVRTIPFLIVSSQGLWLETVDD